MPFFAPALLASPAWALLKRALPYIIVAAVVAGGVWYWQHLERTVDKLKAENKQLVVERDAWKQSFGELKKGLEEQKKILETVVKQGNQLKQDFTKLNSNVNSKIGTINTQLGKIKDQDLSKLNDKQAIDYLRDAAIQRKGSQQ